MKDNWNELTIGNEINFLGGFPFSSSKFNEEGDGVPLIRIRDLLKSSQVTYFSGPYSNTYLINEGDVLIGMDGDFHIVRWKNSHSLLNQRILKVSGKKSGEIDIDFLFYYLNPFLLDVHNKTAATTVKHLSTFDVSRAVDLFPPLPQQKKIAKILTTVDNVIEKTGSAIAKYQAIKQGLMHDLFTRGIDVDTGKLRPTPQEAPALYKESVLGLIPIDWEVDGILEKCDEIFLGLTTKVDYVPEGGVPLIRAKDVNSGYLKFDEVLQISKRQHKDLTKNRKAKRGDVLITKSGTLGISALVDSDIEFSIYESIMVLQPKKKELFSKFLLWLLREPTTLNRLLGQTVGSTIGHLNLINFRELQVVFPKYEEQKLISSKVDALDSKIQTEQQALVKYQQLKAGLLQDLLTGKVEVSVN